MRKIRMIKEKEYEVFYRKKYTKKPYFKNIFFNTSIKNIKEHLSEEGFIVTSYITRWIKMPKLIFTDKETALEGANIIRARHPNIKMSVKSIGGDGVIMFRSYYSKNISKTLLARFGMKGLSRQ